MAWEINQLTLAAVQRLIDQFFDVGIEKFDLYLDGIEINDNEFKDLIGNPDSSNGATNNDIITDEYIYDIDTYEKSPGNCFKVMKKLVLKYRINDKEENHNYVLYYIGGFHDEIRVNCNEP
ncbi:MAG: AcrID1 family anti-CRISPR protein [Candidatus Nanopusillus acidilobi]